MMVGAMQREIMESIVNLQAGVTRIADPFAGGGTVQSEAMFLGLDVVSQDINPLAILLCRVKGECVDAASASAAGQRVIEAAEGDAGVESEIVFLGLTKWFRPEAVVGLAQHRLDHLSAWVAARHATMAMPGGR
jgi:D12 class N6 adenine-specific DNA methyltransferase